MKKTFIIGALLALPVLRMAAAGPEDEKIIIEFVEHNDTSEYYMNLHENAPHLVNVKDVPRFAIVGKDKKFYMGIGANIKTVGEFDFGNPVSNPNMFITEAIPMHQAPGNGGQFRVTAQQSNLYLNVLALPGSKHQLGAYVSMSFLNNGYNPYLQHAYMKYAGITAGYTFSIFTDGAACAPTIDYEGPNALTAVVHGMVSYQHNFGKDKMWSAGVGVDMPTASVTTSDATASVTQRVPDVPFYLQRSWADGHGWLRLSGIVRNILYRDLSAGKNKDCVGWGVKLSGTSPIAGGLSAYYQAVYGEGICSYIQDLTGCGMDLMPSAGNPGKLDAVKSWAGYLGLQYDFSPKMFCTFTYSHVRTYADKYNDSSTPWGEGYRYAQYIATNVFYNINSIVQVGAEYLYGRRVNYSGLQAHDNRFEAMLQVSF